MTSCCGERWKRYMSNSGHPSSEITARARILPLFLGEIMQKVERPFDF